MRAATESGVWRQTTLGDIGTYLNGRGFKKSEWSDAGRMIIRIQDLTGSRTAPNYFDGDCDERHVVRDGDLLISWAATLDAFLWRGPEAVLNQHIFKVETKIDQRLHYWVVKAALADIRRRAHGSGMVHVTKREFERTPVRIPSSRAEQHRVADAIDTQMSQLDDVLLLLASARRKLEALSACLLAAACEGRLAPRGTDESRWETVRYGELVTHITSGSRGWRKYLHRGDGRFVLAQDVRDGSVEVAAATRIDPPAGGEAARTRIEENDILVTIVGDVGRTARVRGDPGDAFVSQSVALTRPRNPSDARFLEIVLRSPRHGQAHFRSKQYGVGRRHLLLSHLRELPVRWPPAQEREQIADAVEAKLSVVEVIDGEIEAAARRAIRLREETLRRAFGAWEEAVA